MTIQLPGGAAAILNILEQQGAQARVVGGCVRDSLRGVPPNDWDICTDMLPQAVAGCLRGQGLTVIETGLLHGTVTALWQGEPFEITTYRVDGAYADARHPVQVCFVDSLQADLARRDFTVNAMAYHPRDGLVDPFGGQRDLAARVIRCVGSPSDRFAEDALRILRALRFAAVLGFAPEPATCAALHQQRALLRQIAAERLQAELRKLVTGSDAARVLTDFADVLGVFIPELLPIAATPARWQRVVRATQAAPPQPVLRLAALLCDCADAEQTTAALRRLKFDNDTTARVCQLVRCHDAMLPPQPVAVKRWLNRLGPDGLRELLALQQALAAAQGRQADTERLAAVACHMQEVLEQRQCYALCGLAVNGRDLLAAGITEGAAVGQLLQALLELVLQEELPNERQALLLAAVDIYRQNGYNS